METQSTLSQVLGLLVNMESRYERWAERNGENRHYWFEYHYLVEEFGPISRQRLHDNWSSRVSRMQQQGLNASWRAKHPRREWECV